MTERATTVAVLGSCMTRDNFNSRFNPLVWRRALNRLMRNLRADLPARLIVQRREQAALTAGTTGVR